MTGASVPARMRAAVEPRKIRRGAAKRLEPTTNTSEARQLSFLSADSSVKPSATSDSISGASGSAPCGDYEVLLGCGDLNLANFLGALGIRKVLGRHQ